MGPTAVYTLRGGQAMPARTGQDYLAGLRDKPREIYLGGQRIEDVTTFPGLASGARSVAALYDMQHDPALRDQMTYARPARASASVSPSSRHEPATIWPGGV
jgi:aromatic ring hydroxylase